MTRLLGLTGGIGSGKSAVAKMFRELGAAVIDADQLAREAVEPGSEGLAAIVERFGSQMLRPEGGLDRAKLGERVFGDPEELAALNAIVHPRVAALAQQRVAELASSGVEVVVYDVPLLYENGLEGGFDAVCVVTVPDDVQRARIKGRDGLSNEAIEARIAAQMPLAEKVSRADHVIDNGGSLMDTRRQVEAVYAALTGGT